MPTKKERRTIARRKAEQEWLDAYTRQLAEDQKKQWTAEVEAFRKKIQEEDKTTFTSGIASWLRRS